MIDYVINKVSDEEYRKLEIGIDMAVDAAVECIENGLEAAMNKFNKKE